MASIKNIFRTHAELALTGAGILLAVSIILILVWGITVLAGDIGASLSLPDSPNTGDSFNLDTAGKLNLRGL